jgi:hypothetical protein
MSTARDFKRKLAAVHRLWAERGADAAIAELEKLRQDWPGSAHLSVLWASLIQLQEKPSHELSEAKAALEAAVELDRASPEAVIELGYFLDSVEDNPKAAAKAFADGVSLARHQLVEGLVGRAKALLQLNKRDEAFDCVAEAMQLMRADPNLKRSERLQELMEEVVSVRSA